MDTSTKTPVVAPAEKARQAVAAYRAQCTDDVYRTLLDIIKSESAKGAQKLNLYHFADDTQPMVALSSKHGFYVKFMPTVAINVAPFVDTEALVLRLENDGFAVSTMPYDGYGRVIDIISWE